MTPGAEHGRGQHFGAHPVFSLVQHDHFQQAVVDQNLVADRDVLYESGVIHVHGKLLFAFCAAHSELQNVAGLQMQISFQVAGANGWALRIEQNCNRAARGLREPADTRHNLAGPFMSSVAHVKPEDISASLDQLSQYVCLFCCRAERADDFGPAHRIKGLNLRRRKPSRF